MSDHLLRQKTNTGASPKYQLIPNLTMTISDGKLFFSSGSFPTVVIEKLHEQESIVALCEFLKKGRTQAEIIDYLMRHCHNTEAAAQTLFNRFLTARFLMMADIFHEQDLYSRNLLFYNLFTPDPLSIQNALEKKHVVLIGSGGIGNTISLHLLHAGVGKLTLVDADRVEASNLTQQIMFTLADTNTQRKTQALAAALKARTQTSVIETLDLFVDQETIHQLPECDLIVLSADSKNVATDVDRYCHEVNTPFIKTGYLAQNAGWGPLVIPSKTPCYHCYSQAYLWPEEANESPLKDRVDAITEQAILSSLSPVVGIACAFAALDVIKFLGGFGQVLSLGQEISIDTLTLQWHYRPTHSRKDCQYCGKRSLCR